MPSLPSQILDLADRSPEGTLICPSALLHLGSRAAVDQALSRLARKGELVRVCRGIYARTYRTRFGICPPDVWMVLTSLSKLWGETIVPCGGMSANGIGLTTQVPMREVHWTSGPSRNLNIGGLKVELQHAPRWQLAAPHRLAGYVIRSLVFLGPHEVEDGLAAIRPRLTPEDLQELADARALMPGWMARPISAMVAREGS